MVVLGVVDDDYRLGLAVIDLVWEGECHDLLQRFSSATELE
eukprot:CAMPEP_0201573426 /NCGR_PEP_ID=MMETSP0190_2-20130828/17296_1 /ASSEMBLY_ACC=CAM_ASM_000263 /TAXON_ID=37353 /ORGANISM="Rosalina sp." /LENGTH=40 /DNA_ID= /DNA_START= /DNA_END= /DNA_ORIENTATION=